MQEILNHSALSLANLVRQGEVSSAELTEYYLDRVEKLNPNLNAFVTVTKGRARRAAKQADKARAKRSSEDLPLFHGVPTGIKDLVPTAGIPTRLGSRAFRYFVPPVSTAVVHRLRAGGFVSLGKLATSEIGVLPITEPDIHAPTRNPWDPNHSPGGSSGGSGAAMASGMLPIAHGSDGGGSVRIPAAFCGVFGFKPSLSLLGNLHGRPNALGLSVMGPLARSVEDAAGMLDVMAGRPHRDRSEASCLEATKHAPKPLRVRLVQKSFVTDIDPEMVAATRKTASLLESLGHHVEEVEPTESSIREFLPIWQFMVARVPVVAPWALQPVTRWIRDAGKQVSLQEARALQNKLCKRIDTLFGDADLILSPTVPYTAPAIGSVDTSDPEAAFYKLAPIGSLTAMFNLYQAPAANLPMALSDSGLPIGVQLGARPEQDRLLLSVCRQVEEAHGHFEQRAP